YAEDYPVTNHYTGSSGSGSGSGSGPGAGSGPGVATWLPTAGQGITQGQPLYQVDGGPVILLYGSTPAYPTLAAGATASDGPGSDVSQLNHDLVALGYVDKSDVDSAWDEFNGATKAGIETLQDHFGLDQTGSLGLGSVVFLPTAVRATTVSAKLGASI